MSAWPSYPASKYRAKPFDVLAFQCRALGLPEPVAEHYFAKVQGRRWRFDAAWVEQRVALEIDGGVFLPGGGRHSRGAGYREDCIKFGEAFKLGWRVLRCLPEQVKNGQAVSWLEPVLRAGRAA